MQSQCRINRGDANDAGINNLLSNADSRPIIVQKDPGCKCPLGKLLQVAGAEMDFFVLTRSLYEGKMYMYDRVYCVSACLFWFEISQLEGMG